MSRGAVVWFTGLPASGKTTAAGQLVRRLRARGREPALLDSDELRAQLVPQGGYQPDARDGFYRTLANLAGLLAAQGLIVVVAATAHRRQWRDLARARAPAFVEVHVATPLDECQRRDPKHLYAEPSAWVALPGAGVAYEPPLQAEVVVLGGDARAYLDAVLAALDRVTADPSSG